MTSYDWLFAGDGEMATRMRSFDWTEHPLGDPGSWTPELKTALAMCLASPAPTQLWWGPSKSLLYNDAAAAILGAAHPAALGRPAPDIYRERWSTFCGDIERASTERTAVTVDELSLRPVIASDGTVAGLVCTDVRHAPRTELAIRLRDPLTTIVAIVDPLQSIADDPVQVPHEDVQRLARAARRLERILGGMFREREADLDLADETPNHSPPAHDAQRPRVLIADDNDDLCAHVAATLADEWSIECVGDGNLALERAMCDPPDLVIADLMMPGLGGADLTQALRGNPRTAHVPVILASSRSGHELRAAGRDAGADDYITKPYTVRELRARAGTLVELNRARTHAMRSATRAKDDFLAMVGHELRNPLATVSTTLQALLMGPPSREVTLMERAVSMLTRLVDDLLESSRLSRGIVTLQQRPIELAQVVDRALELISPEHDGSCKIVVSVPRTGVRVNADPERLARAIGNVVMNAVQHSPAAGKVTIDVERVKDRLHLHIADHGEGIAPDRLGTIFDAFQHAHAPARKSGGLGLGLAIARGVVELHGGVAAVASQGVGLGTTCTIDLPSTTAADQPVKPARAGARRLLLVEDNDDTGRSLKAALELLGYEVALAHNGPIALNLARTFNPDVALLDLGLPVMDGWELAKRLRATARELPIVAVTARDQEADKQRSAEIGFADHLVKPINLRQLAQLVETLPNRSA